MKEIKIPKENRGQGIGSEIIKMIQAYASQVKKPIVLTPQAERGRKADLERFYKSLGFVDNKGKNMDYSLSNPFGKTMIWKFKEWFINNI